MIRVKVRDTADRDRVVETFQPAIYVGRAPDCGILLEAPGVEWRHGQLLDREGRVFYRDLRSAVGSLIRSAGKEDRPLANTIHEVEVFPGDEIMLADASVEILCAESRPYAEDLGAAMPIMESWSSSRLEELVHRLENNHRVLEQIYRFEKQLSDVFDLNRLFGAISDAVFEVYEKATHLFVALVDGESMDLVLAGRRPEVKVPDGPAALSRFLVEQVVQKGEALLFHLTKTGSLELRQKESRVIDPTKSVRLNRIQSGICAPLWSGTSIIGVLEVDNRVEATPFTADERDLLVLFANRTALAIEKHRRYSKDLQAARDATIGQVVSKVVHDLTNHFGVLRPLGELTDLDFKSVGALLDGGSMDEELVRKALSSLYGNWQRVRVHHELMWDLLDDLRHYARDREPEYEPVPVRDIMDVCLESARFRALDRERAVTFQVTGDLDRIRFTADAIGVRRAVQNLVNNAVDAIPRGRPGAVEISVRGVGEGNLPYVRISVRDDGTGIPEDLLGRIFDYGFSTKAGMSGSGFGLAVIAKIVREHRGFIRIRSLKDVGTEVELFFPAVSGSERAAVYQRRESDLVEVVPWPAVPVIR